MQPLPGLLLRNSVSVTIFWETLFFTIYIYIEICSPIMVI